MTEKIKRILSICYVVFFAPFCVNFLFPLVQLYFLGKDRDYYLMSSVSVSNVALVVLSIIVSFVVLVVNTRRIYDILYYFLGLLIGILFKNEYQEAFGMGFLYENLLYGIFATGYLFVLLCIAVEAIWGRRSRTAAKI